MKGVESTGRVPNLQSARRISGFTHPYYRYPATTSPELIRDIVLGYSTPGELVLDPFMGGGTSIVESVAHGRQVIGLDLNPLAVLVARAKTTPLTGAQWKDLHDWAWRTDLFRPRVGASDDRTRNLPRRIALSFGSTLDQLHDLSDSSTRLLARCALLSLGRWSLESSRELPPPRVLRKELRGRVSLMEHGMNELLESARSYGVTKSQVAGSRRLICSSAEDAASALAGSYSGRVGLVVTSPPYPGVHVLYHRWQVEGRKETPAAYWIADRRDGAGPAFYTMGGRSERGEATYFSRLETVFTGLRPLLADDATVVQLVAFHNIEKQLPRFLSVMRRAGYQPHNGDGGGRLSRVVPNRRWYARDRDFNSSREFLLIHKPS